MKRYLIFKGTYYYPIGGMEDFFKDVGSIESYKEAIDNFVLQEYEKEKDIFSKQEFLKYFYEEFWFQVYDTVKQEIVYKTYR